MYCQWILDVKKIADTNSDRKTFHNSNTHTHRYVNATTKAVHPDVKYGMFITLST